MAWLPSHSSLARHPKLKRAARLAKTTEPAMIGHLHLLWWWALELAPEGDLSAYDPEDIADAAGWTEEPEVFLEALKNCGPRDCEGFLNANMKLHDWEEYGGRYSARVEAARAAANARWSKKRSEPNADALLEQEEAHATGNAEKSRVEKSREEKKRTAKRKTSMTESWQPDEQNLERLRARYPKVDIEAELGKFRDHWLSKGETRADWNAGLRTWCANAESYRQARDGERAGGWR